MNDNVTLRCVGCGISHDLGEMDLGGKTRAEKWGAAMGPAEKAGWLIVIRPTGRRDSLCPTCKKKDPAKVELPPYSGPDATCAKCLHVKPKTEYQQAGEVEFLGRTCTNCGHRWVEAPADARRPWWKRVFGLKGK